MRGNLAIVMVFIISLFAVATEAQVIKSEKVKKHVSTGVMKVEEASADTAALEIISPSLVKNQTFVSEEERINIAGKVKSEGEGFQAFINGEETTLTSDNFFYMEISLNPGMNRIRVSVLQGDNIVGHEVYQVFYTARPVNLAAKDLTGKYYALIIGINEYIYPEINSLDYAVRDAMEVHQILTDFYTFEEEDIKMLLNPGRDEIIIALDHFAEKITSSDNFLIFYAGHGHWEANVELGYWLPADASRANRAAWISNSNLVDYLKAIGSKHTLLISDACFSGSIFQTRTAFSDAPKAIERLYELPSRKAITSGTLSEVPDNSVFIKYLKDRLINNTETWLPAEQLFSSLRIAVINNSEDMPRYGEIRGTGDQGGDFIFIRRGK